MYHYLINTLIIICILNRLQQIKLRQFNAKGIHLFLIHKYF